MKLNLIEINKLTPPGLWDLGLLASVMAMLRGVLASGHGPALLYGRMLLQYSESLRNKTRDNLNMRIKAWVMQCPDRIAYVRNIIGEAAIRKWHKNRLADYTLTKYFGDWKRKWPDGFKNGGFKNGGFARKTISPKPKKALSVKMMQRAYNWQVFALVKIVNVERFLYGQTDKKPNCNDIQTAFQKLWNVDITDVINVPKWSQPRQQRILKPVEFTPYELTPEIATEPSQNDEQPIEIINNTDEKKLHAPPKNEREDTRNNIQTKKKKPP